MNRPGIKGTSSLHDIMNDMVQDPSGLNGERRRTLRETDAFASLDPVLSGLAKQRADANAHFARLLKSHGGDDPLTTVAADMLDSAQSAWETRMLELQQDRKTMAKVRRMMRESRAAIAHAERKADAIQHLRLQLFSGRTAAPGREGEFNVKLNQILSLLGTLQTVIDEAHKTLCLAKTFAHACQTRSGAV